MTPLHAMLGHVAALGQASTGGAVEPAGFIELVVALWWNWIAPVSVQAALLACLVTLLDCACGRTRWPGLRAAAWWLVLLRLVLPPWLVSPVGLLPWSSEAGGAEEMQGSIMSGGLALLLWVVWLVGVAILMATAGWRHHRLRRAWLSGAGSDATIDRLAARAATRMGCRVAPRVLVGPSVGGAAVLGVLRPVVVLPRALVEALPRDRLEHILMHECAHLARRDPLWSALACILHMLFWFHPAAWLARRRVAALRELSCDRRVALALRHEAPEYRRTLLELARPLVSAVGRGPELAFTYGGSLLMARLALLEAGQRQWGWRHRAASSLLVAVLAACCVLPGPPPRVSLPAWDQTQGCLQKRFLLYDLLAREALPPPAIPPAVSPSTNPSERTRSITRIPPSLRSTP